MASNGDRLSNLPILASKQPTEAELRMLQNVAAANGGKGYPLDPSVSNSLRNQQLMMMGAQNSSLRSFGGDELKRLVVPTLAFIVLSLSWTDSMIRNLYPSVTPGLMVVIKIVSFVLVIIVAQIFGFA